MANQLSLSLYDELINGFTANTAAITKSRTVQEARQKGLEQFKKTGFPTRRNEEWKYTNITPFLQEKYVVDESTAASSCASIETAVIPHLDCYRLVLVNGQLQVNEQLAQIPSFVHIHPVSEAQNNESFAAHFTKTTNIEQAAFASLNTALFSDGVFIEINPNAVLEKPIHLIHLFTAENNNVLVQPRHLVIVRKSAGITFIETVVSNSGSSKVMVNSLTEIFVEENATCNHYVLQTAQSGARLINQTEISQKRHSVYSNYTFSLPSAELIRNNLHVSLNEPNTESHLFGLYLGAGNQLIDNHSLVNHKMPYCNSNEVYKGVLTENSTGVFNGKIFVQQDAQKTNAFQQNNNLLLSEKASVDSKPQLEIFADDVKCSHGSTVGQLSKEALFYLQSRGIGEQNAKALLVNAFLFDVTEKIKIPALEEHLKQLITQHIPLGERITQDAE